MRKVCLFVLTMMMSFAMWADDFTVDGINYTTTSDTEAAVAYGSYSGEVTIPATITYESVTYSVTSIGEYAFNNCRNLTSITIPEGVTSIGSWAFNNCSSLTSITIPEDVTNIGWCALRGCSSLISITIPNESKLTSIGTDAFEGTAWYGNHPNGVVYAGKVLYEYKGTMPENTSIEVKEGTISINLCAFLDCSSLTSIAIPESVTSIGDGAFSGCSSLTSIIIPEGVTSIGYNAFYGCSSLTSIILPESITNIKDYTFSHCSNLTSMNIPKGVTEIGPYAFYYSGLTSITIPESVTSIGYEAFNGCSSLTSIIIPEGVTDIGYGLFWNCTSLSSIILPESITNIKDYTFSGCSNLASITIPEGVTSIGSDAFSGCSSLTSVYISSLEAWCNIDFPRNSDSHPLSYAENLYMNGELMTELVIPNTWTKIKDYVFSGYRGLTSITCEATTPITIGRNTFSDKSIPVYVPSASVKAYQEADYWSEFTNIQSDCIGSGECGDNLVWTLTRGGELIIEGTGPMNDYYAPWSYYSESIKKVTIKDGVTSIGNYAFEGCSNLTSIVVAEGNTIFDSRDNCNAIIETNTNTLILGCGSTIIPYTVSKIGNFAFEDCSSLTSISIPEGVTAIGEYAISGCDNLVSVYIPKSVTEIGLGAFAYNSSLSSIVIDEGNTVYDSRNNCNAIIETSSNTLIQGFPITVIPNTVKTIGCYAFEGYRNLPSITIPEGVTTIEKGAFEESNLTSITIPESVVEIKGQALHSTPWYDNQPDGAIYLGKVLYTYKGTMAVNTSFNIREGTTSIGTSAFENCSNLASITIPESVKSIGECAFMDCENLYSVDIANGVMSIGSSAFEDCSNLTSVKLPEDITRIEDCTFENCFNLASISIPKHVELIGARAFGYCGITSIVIPEDVTSVEAEAFRGCFYLTSITIPKGVTSIGGEAFAECVNLASITCEADIPPTIGYSSPFEGVEKSIPVYVPASSISAYQTAEYWKEFTNIQAIASDVLATSLTLDVTEASLAPNEALTLSATLLPEDVSNPSLTWTSSNEKVAIVDTMGKVTAIAPGTTTITATANDGSGVSASCEVTVTPASYIITFLVDGEVYATETLKPGATITVPDAPTKEGHTFSGWSGLPETMPAKDITVSATFTVNKYQVTFKIDGVVIATYTQDYGSAIVAPEAPEREGYTFSGWGDVAETVPASDVTYEGSYSANLYNVYYFVGATLVHSVKVAYGEPIPEYIYEPEEEGYTFLGWIGETYASMPAHDVTYTANIDNGVGQLTDDNGQLNIYDLTGRKVTDTENLKGGIYIINGKKVVIK